MIVGAGVDLGDIPYVQVGGVAEHSWHSGVGVEVVKCQEQTARCPSLQQLFILIRQVTRCTELTKLGAPGLSRMAVLQGYRSEIREGTTLCVF